MFIGIDLGGTNIAVGVVDENNNIIASDSTPTLAERHWTEIVKDMAELTKKVTADAGFTLDDIESIGIGCPGTIDTDNGMVVYSNNIVMDHAPVADEIKKNLGIDVPVNLENDANAAAYGEYIATGANAKSFIFITLGTGVGGGVVLNGKLYRGFNFAGAELGHFIMNVNGEPCSCGAKGCWEAYASVTALIRQTKVAMEANPDSLMNKIAEENGKVSGRTSFTAAAEGDKAAIDVVNKYIEYVATGIASMVNIFQPEILVIGGGISKEGDRILNPLKDIVNSIDYNKFMPKTDIRIAKLYNDAGIIGAALAAKQ